MRSPTPSAWAELGRLSSARCSGLGETVFNWTRPVWSGGRPYRFEIGGDLTELNPRGDRLQFDGAGPIHFSLSADTVVCPGHTRITSRPTTST